MKALRHHEIFGNWSTLLLATKNNGSIDYAKLSDEIDCLIASKPNGIYSNGTAGEFYAQAENEFDRISQMLAEKCDRNGVPFQIGVSHMSAQISLERLRRIKQLKPGAVQVILPDWFPVTLSEAITFLKRLADEAEDIGLILYNPPHAKRQLKPLEWSQLKRQVPALMGMKVFDHDGAPSWYEDVRRNSNGLSVFIPGHRLASGIQQGAHGAYSNMACLNPFAAQRWYELILADMDAALEVERRINIFMKKCIHPLIVRDQYANHACDRFLAQLGGWADVGHGLRWPYHSIPVALIEPVQKEGMRIIPEFFKN
jgi:dihydrodipicolinate synthase/N-acetylneuraminate lyase